MTRERTPPQDHPDCGMESMQPIFATHQKHESSASKQNFQPLSPQKQSLDIQQQRQAEQNLPNELTEDIVIQHSEQNPNPCLDNERMKPAEVDLRLLFQTIKPHVEESKAMSLQMHYAKFLKKEIHKTDFARLLTMVAGKQLFVWALQSMQRRAQFSSVTMPLEAGINTDMSSKKRPIGQNKQLEETHNHSLLRPRKKKKVSVGIPEQSTRELDGETALSGVNIREEAQLSSGHKEELQSSETAQKDALKEERMILQKVPLQRKLTEIISKYGITHISNSVERCLSLCVEERMRAVITNLIKMSKMRVDPELPVHQKSITSDVRLQILMINSKAKKVHQKPQAEEDILLRKREEANKHAEDNIRIIPTVAPQPAVEEDDSLLNLQLLAEKAERKHDWKISAANKAANNEFQTAVSGQDLLLRWQLMAKQAREKRQGGVCKDASQAALSTSKRATCYNKEPGTTTSAHPAPSSSRKSGTKSATLTKPGRRDVIAVFEREACMSKSTLLYRLYEKRVC